MAESDVSSSKQPRAQADPHAELPIKNYKYVKNCTELYLSERGIEELAHFEGFVNLESLWINKNHITSLEGLDQCFRIKELYAQDNRIKSLQGSSLVHFKFLQTLRLNNNRIRDLQSTLAVLMRLHHLEDLDLYMNPVEEEDNYRLHVIRTVPSLLVLDRHVITDEERVKAGRLHDELALASKHTDNKGHAALPEKLNANKKHGANLVPGAPPQVISGTVKLLFKEVDKIQRETEAAKRAAVERELQLMAEQQLQLTTPSKATPTSHNGSATIGGLDAWEVAALEKKFKTLEDKPGAGIPPDRLVELLSYLADRGFATSYLGRSSSEFNSMELLQTLLPGATKIQWKQLKQSWEKNQLQSRLLPPAELKQRAKASFDQAAKMQKRLLSGKNASADDEKVVKEMHDVVQRAYRFTALAEGSQHGDAGRRRGKLSHEMLAPLRTRYYTNTFAREETETAEFHELKEQSKQVDSDLAAKFKFQHKDFHKYLVTKAPPVTTLTRKQFTM